MFKPVQGLLQIAKCTADMRAMRSAPSAAGCAELLGTLGLAGDLGRTKIHCRSSHSSHSLYLYIFFGDVNVRVTCRMAPPPFQQSVSRGEKMETQKL